MSTPPLISVRLLSFCLFFFCFVFFCFFSYFFFVFFFFFCFFFFVASEKVKVLNHPPYSPDLSPYDFFLFPKLKKMLSGNNYTSRSSLGSAIYKSNRYQKKTINLLFATG